MKVLFFKTVAAREKPALTFLLKLLILGCLLKCIFFAFNYRLTNGWDISSAVETLSVLKWSLINDAFVITMIALAFLLALLPGVQSKAYVQAVTMIVAVVITAFVCLNAMDIFYFRFHLQRANADLLFVLRNPLGAAHFFTFIMFAAAVAFIIGAAYFSYQTALATALAPGGRRFPFTIIALAAFMGLFLLTGTKKLLPAFPLTIVKPVQLPLVQNSLHTFLYSLYRREESRLPPSEYFSSAVAHSIIPIRKKNEAVVAPKNIVLFIMESVPMEFFETASVYKVSMPFLDSLVNKSTIYSNAFSYAYSSNKGITAILAGLPTLTDIPLYHSNYTSIERTSIGTVLEKKNYSSAFFIGDNYDDFGFAKCMRWLGIEKYYSMENIPGHRQMEKHSMGLHDEYVLNFMETKLSAMQAPFFAVNYNISTHYPNELPVSFQKKFPKPNGSPQMKSMQYYDACLKSFFENASAQEWYKNSVFIFCSDHWAQPNTGIIAIDEVNSFRIPIFIYDPQREVAEKITSPVSQLDIVNTLLSYAAAKDSFLSYGFDLREAKAFPNRTVFCKTNSAVYQAINDRYVLGFDATQGKALYCYDYVKDINRKTNLLPTANVTIATLEKQMKAFLQTAVEHHKNPKANPPASMP